MKIEVILLSFLLYWDAAYPEPRRQKLNDQIVSKVNRDSDDFKVIGEHAAERWRMNDGGVNSRERGANENDSSWSSWRGLFLDAEKRQEPFPREPSNINIRKDSAKTSSSNQRTTPLNSGNRVRNRRSIWKPFDSDMFNLNRDAFKSVQPTSAETRNEGSTLRKITEKSNAKSNPHRSSLYKRKFSNDIFDDFDDWFMLGRTFNAGDFTRTFYEPSSSGRYVDEDRNEHEEPSNGRTASKSHEISPRNEERFKERSNEDRYRDEHREDSHGDHKSNVSSFSSGKTHKSGGIFDGKISMKGAQHEENKKGKFDDKRRKTFSMDPSKIDGENFPWWKTGLYGGYLDESMEDHGYASKHGRVNAGRSFRREYREPRMGKGFDREYVTYSPRYLGKFKSKKLISREKDRYLGKEHTIDDEYKTNQNGRHRGTKMKSGVKDKKFLADSPHKSVDLQNFEGRRNENLEKVDDSWGFLMEPGEIHGNSYRNGFYNGEYDFDTNGDEHWRKFGKKYDDSHKEPHSMHDKKISNYKIAKEYDFDANRGDRWGKFGKKFDDSHEERHLMHGKKVSNNKIAKEDNFDANRDKHWTKFGKKFGKKFDDSHKEPHSIHNTKVPNNKIAKEYDFDVNIGEHWKKFDERHKDPHSIHDKKVPNNKIAKEYDFHTNRDAHWRTFDDSHKDPHLTHDEKVPSNKVAKEYDFDTNRDNHWRTFGMKFDDSHKEPHLMHDERVPNNKVAEEYDFDANKDKYWTEFGKRYEDSDKEPHSMHNKKVPNNKVAEEYDIRKSVHSNLHPKDYESEKRRGSIERLNYKRIPTEFSSDHEKAENKKSYERYSPHNGRTPIEFSKRRERILNKENIEDKRHFYIPDPKEHLISTTRNKHVEDRQKPPENERTSHYNQKTSIEFSATHEKIPNKGNTDEKKQFHISDPKEHLIATTRNKHVEDQQKRPENKRHFVNVIDIDERDDYDYSSHHGTANRKTNSRERANEGEHRRKEANRVKSMEIGESAGRRTRVDGEEENESDKHKSVTAEISAGARIMANNRADPAKHRGSNEGESTLKEDGIAGRGRKIENHWTRMHERAREDVRDSSREIEPSKERLDGKVNVNRGGADSAENRGEKWKFLDRGLKINRRNKSARYESDERTKSGLFDVENYERAESENFSGEIDRRGSVDEEEGEDRLKWLPLRRTHVANRAKDDSLERVLIKDRENIRNPLQKFKQFDEDVRFDGVSTKIKDSTEWHGKGSDNEDRFQEEGHDFVGEVLDESHMNFKEDNTWINYNKSGKKEYIYDGVNYGGEEYKNMFHEEEKQGRGNVNMEVNYRDIPITAQQSEEKNSMELHDLDVERSKNKQKLHKEDPHEMFSKSDNSIDNKSVERKYLPKSDEVKEKHVDKYERRNDFINSFNGNRGTMHGNKGKESSKMTGYRGITDDDETRNRMILEEDKIWKHYEDVNVDEETASVMKEKKNIENKDTLVTKMKVSKKNWVQEEEDNNNRVHHEASPSRYLQDFNKNVKQTPNNPFDNYKTKTNKTREMLSLPEEVSLKGVHNSKHNTKFNEINDADLKIGENMHKKRHGKFNEEEYFEKEEHGNWEEKKRVELKEKEKFKTYDEGEDGIFLKNSKSHAEDAEGDEFSVYLKDKEIKISPFSSKAKARTSTADGKTSDEKTANVDDKRYTQKIEGNETTRKLKDYSLRQKNEENYKNESPYHKFNEADYFERKYGRRNSKGEHNKSKETKKLAATINYLNDNDKSETLASLNFKTVAKASQENGDISSEDRRTQEEDRKENKFDARAERKEKLQIAKSGSNENHNSKVRAFINSETVARTFEKHDERLAESDEAYVENGEGKEFGAYSKERKEMQTVTPGWNENDGTKFVASKNTPTVVSVVPRNEETSSKDEVYVEGREETEYNSYLNGKEFQRLRETDRSPKNYDSIIRHGKNFAQEESETIKNNIRTNEIFGKLNHRIYQQRRDYENMGPGSKFIQEERFGREYGGINEDKKGNIAFKENKKLETVMYDLSEAPASANVVKVASASQKDDEILLDRGAVYVPDAERNESAFYSKNKEIHAQTGSSEGKTRTSGDGDDAGHKKSTVANGEELERRMMLQSINAESLYRNEAGNTNSKREENNEEGEMMKKSSSLKVSEEAEGLNDWTLRRNNENLHGKLSIASGSNEEHFRKKFGLVNGNSEVYNIGFQRKEGEKGATSDSNGYYASESTVNDDARIIAEKIEENTRDSAKNRYIYAKDANENEFRMYPDEKKKTHGIITDPNADHAFKDPVSNPKTVSNNSHPNIFSQSDEIHNDDITRHKSSTISKEKNRTTLIPISNKTYNPEVLTSKIIQSSPQKDNKIPEYNNAHTSNTNLHEPNAYFESKQINYLPPLTDTSYQAIDGKSASHVESTVIEEPAKTNLHEPNAHFEPKQLNYLPPSTDTSYQATDDKSVSHVESAAIEESAKTNLHEPNTYFEPKQLNYLPPSTDKNYQAIDDKSANHVESAAIEESAKTNLHKPNAYFEAKQINYLPPSTDKNDQATDDKSANHIESAATEEPAKTNLHEPNAYFEPKQINYLSPSTDTSYQAIDDKSAIHIESAATEEPAKTNLHEPNAYFEPKQINYLSPSTDTSYQAIDDKSAIHIESAATEEPAKTNLHEPTAYFEPKQINYLPPSTDTNYQAINDKSASHVESTAIEEAAKTHEHVIAEHGSNVDHVSQVAVTANADAAANVSDSNGDDGSPSAAVEAHATKVKENGIRGWRLNQGDVSEEQPAAGARGIISPDESVRLLESSDANDRTDMKGRENDGVTRNLIPNQELTNGGNSNDVSGFYNAEIKSEEGSNDLSKENDMGDDKIRAEGIIGIDKHVETVGSNNVIGGNRRKGETGGGGLIRKWEKLRDDNNSNDVSGSLDTDNGEKGKIDKSRDENESDLGGPREEGAFEKQYTRTTNRIGDLDVSVGLLESTSANSEINVEKEKEKTRTNDPRVEKISIAQVDVSNFKENATHPFATHQRQSIDVDNGKTDVYDVNETEAAKVEKERSIQPFDVSSTAKHNELFSGKKGNLKNKSQDEATALLSKAKQISGRIDIAKDDKNEDNDNSEAERELKVTANEDDEGTVHNVFKNGEVDKKSNTSSDEAENERSTALSGRSTSDEYDKSKTPQSNEKFTSGQITVKKTTDSMQKKGKNSYDNSSKTQESKILATEYDNGPGDITNSKKMTASMKTGHEYIPGIEEDKIMMHGSNSDEEFNYPISQNTLLGENNNDSEEIEEKSRSVSDTGASGAEDKIFDANIQFGTNESVKNGRWIDDDNSAPAEKKDNTVEHDFNTIPAARNSQSTLSDSEETRNRENVKKPPLDLNKSNEFESLSAADARMDAVKTANDEYGEAVPPVRDKEGEKEEALYDLIGKEAPESSSAVNNRPNKNNGMVDGQHDLVRSIAAENLNMRKEMTTVEQTGLQADEKISIGNSRVNNDHYGNDESSKLTSETKQENTSGLNNLGAHELVAKETTRNLSAMKNKLDTNNDASEKYSVSGSPAEEKGEALPYDFIKKKEPDKQHSARIYSGYNSDKSQQYDKSITKITGALEFTGDENKNLKSYAKQVSEENNVLIEVDNKSDENNVVKDEATAADLSKDEKSVEKITTELKVGEEPEHSSIMNLQSDLIKDDKENKILADAECERNENNIIEDEVTAGHLNENEEFAKLSIENAEIDINDSANDDDTESTSVIKGMDPPITEHQETRVHGLIKNEAFGALSAATIPEHIDYDANSKSGDLSTAIAETNKVKWKKEGALQHELVESEVSDVSTDDDNIITDLDQIEGNNQSSIVNDDGNGAAAEENEKMADGLGQNGKRHILSNEDSVGNINYDVKDESSKLATEDEERGKNEVENEEKVDQNSNGNEAERSSASGAESISAGISEKYSERMAASVQKNINTIEEKKTEGHDSGREEKQKNSSNNNGEMNNSNGISDKDNEIISSTEETDKKTIGNAANVGESNPLNPLFTKNDQMNTQNIKNNELGESVSKDRDADIEEDDTEARESIESKNSDDSPLEDNLRDSEIATNEFDKSVASIRETDSKTIAETERNPINEEYPPESPSTENNQMNVDRIKNNEFNKSVFSTKESDSKKETITKENSIESDISDALPAGNHPIDSRDILNDELNETDLTKGMKDSIKEELSEDNLIKNKVSENLSTAGNKIENENGAIDKYGESIPAAREADADKVKNMEIAAEDLINSQIYTASSMKSVQLDGKYSESVTAPSETEANKVKEDKISINESIEGHVENKASVANVQENIESQINGFVEPTLLTENKSDGNECEENQETLTDDSVEDQRSADLLNTDSQVEDITVEVTDHYPLTRDADKAESSQRESNESMRYGLNKNLPSMIPPTASCKKDIDAKTIEKYIKPDTERSSTTIDQQTINSSEEKNTLSSHKNAPSKLEENGVAEDNSNMSRTAEISQTATDKKHINFYDSKDNIALSNTANNANKLTKKDEKIPQEAPEQNRSIERAVENSDTIPNVDKSENQNVFSTSDSEANAAKFEELSATDSSSDNEKEVLPSMTARIPTENNVLGENDVEALKKNNTEDEFISECPECVQTEEESKEIEESKENGGGTEELQARDVQTFADYENSVVNDELFKDKDVYEKKFKGGELENYSAEETEVAEENIGGSRNLEKNSVPLDTSDEKHSKTIREDVSKTDDLEGNEVSRSLSRRNKELNNPEHKVKNEEAKTMHNLEKNYAFRESSIAEPYSTTTEVNENYLKTLPVTKSENEFNEKFDSDAPTIADSENGNSSIKDPKQIELPEKYPENLQECQTLLSDMTIENLSEEIFTSSNEISLGTNESTKTNELFSEKKGLLDKENDQKETIERPSTSNDESEASMNDLAANLHSEKRNIPSNTHNLHSIIHNNKMQPEDSTEEYKTPSTSARKQTNGDKPTENKSSVVDNEVTSETKEGINPLHNLITDHDPEVHSAASTRAEINTAFEEHIESSIETSEEYQTTIATNESLARDSNTNFAGVSKAINNEENSENVAEETEGLSENYNEVYGSEESERMRDKLNEKEGSAKGFDHSMRNGIDKKNSRGFNDLDNGGIKNEENFEIGENIEQDSGSLGDLKGEIVRGVNDDEDNGGQALENDKGDRLGLINDGKANYELNEEGETAEPIDKNFEVTGNRNAVKNVDESSKIDEESQVAEEKGSTVIENNLNEIEVSQESSNASPQGVAIPDFDGQSAEPIDKNFEVTGIRNAVKNVDESSKIDEESQVAEEKGSTVIENNFNENEVSRESSIASPQGVAIPDFDGQSASSVAIDPIHAEVSRDDNESSSNLPEDQLQEALISYNDHTVINSGQSDLQKNIPDKNDDLHQDKSRINSAIDERYGDDLNDNEKLKKFQDYNNEVSNSNVIKSTSLNEDDARGNVMHNFSIGDFKHKIDEVNDAEKEKGLVHSTADKTYEEDSNENEEFNNVHDLNSVLSNSKIIQPDSTNGSTPQIASITDTRDKNVEANDVEEENNLIYINSKETEKGDLTKNEKFTNHRDYNSKPSNSKMLKPNSFNQNDSMESTSENFNINDRGGTDEHLNQSVESIERMTKQRNPNVHHLDEKHVSASSSNPNREIMGSSDVYADGEVSFAEANPERAMRTKGTTSLEVLNVHDSKETEIDSEKNRYKLHGINGAYGKQTSFIYGQVQASHSSAKNAKTINQGHVEQLKKKENESETNRSDMDLIMDQKAQEKDFARETSISIQSDDDIMNTDSNFREKEEAERRMEYDLNKNSLPKIKSVDVSDTQEINGTHANDRNHKEFVENKVSTTNAQTIASSLKHHDSSVKNNIHPHNPNPENDTKFYSTNNEKCNIENNIASPTDSSTEDNTESLLKPKGITSTENSRKNSRNEASSRLENNISKEQFQSSLITKTNSLESQEHMKLNSSNENHAFDTPPAHNPKSISTVTAVETDHSTFMIDGQSDDVDEDTTQKRTSNTEYKHEVMSTEERERNLSLATSSPAEFAEVISADKSDVAYGDSDKDRDLSTKLITEIDDDEEGGDRINTRMKDDSVSGKPEDGTVNDTRRFDSELGRIDETLRDEDIKNKRKEFRLMFSVKHYKSDKPDRQAGRANYNLDSMTKGPLEKGYDSKDGFGISLDKSDALFDKTVHLSVKEKDDKVGNKISLCVEQSESSNENSADVMNSHIIKEHNVLSEIGDSSVPDASKSRRKSFVNSKIEEISEPVSKSDNMSESYGRKSQEISMPQSETNEGTQSKGPDSKQVSSSDVPKSQPTLELCGSKYSEFSKEGTSEESHFEHKNIKESTEKNEAYKKYNYAAVEKAFDLKEQNVHADKLYAEKNIDHVDKLFNDIKKEVHRALSDQSIPGKILKMKNGDGMLPEIDLKAVEVKLNENGKLSDSKENNSLERKMCKDGECNENDDADLHNNQFKLWKPWNTGNKLKNRRNYRNKFKNFLNPRRKMSEWHVNVESNEYGADIEKYLKSDDFYHKSFNRKIRYDNEGNYQKKNIVTETSSTVPPESGIADEDKISKGKESTSVNKYSTSKQCESSRDSNEGHLRKLKGDKSARNSNVEHATEESREVNTRKIEDTTEENVESPVAVNKIQIAKLQVVQHENETRESKEDESSDLSAVGTTYKKSILPIDSQHPQISKEEVKTVERKLHRNEDAGATEIAVEMVSSRTYTAQDEKETNMLHGKDKNEISKTITLAKVEGESEKLDGNGHGYLKGSVATSKDNGDYERWLLWREYYSKIKKIDSSLIQKMKPYFVGIQEFENGDRYLRKYKALYEKSASSDEDSINTDLKECDYSGQEAVDESGDKYFLSSATADDKSHKFDRKNVKSWPWLSTKPTDPSFQAKGAGSYWNFFHSEDDDFHYSFDNSRSNEKLRGSTPYSEKVKSPSAEEDSNNEFESKEQVGSSKFGRSNVGLSCGGELEVPVSMSSIETQSSDREGSRRIAAAESAGIAELRKSEVINDVLQTTSGSVTSRQVPHADVKSTEVGDIYGDVSSDVKDAEDVNRRTGVAVKSADTSAEEAKCRFKVPEKEKVEVYIVRRNSRGPVRVTHMRGTTPRLVSYGLIPKKVYERTLRMFAKNQIFSKPYPIRSISRR